MTYLLVRDVPGFGRICQRIYDKDVVPAKEAATFNEQPIQRKTSQRRQASDSQKLRSPVLTIQHFIVQLFFHLEDSDILSKYYKVCISLT